MKIIYLVLVFLCVYPCNFYAQDSVAIIKRLDTLFALEFNSKQKDEVINLRDSSKKIGFIDGVKHANNWLIYYNDQKGNYTQSQQYIQENKTFPSTYSKIQIGYNLLEIAHNYMDLEKPEKVSSYIYDAFKIAKDFNNIELKIHALECRSMMYSILGDYDKAIDDQEIRRDYYRKQKNRRQEELANYNIAFNFVEKGEPGRSIPYLIEYNQYMINIKDSLELPFGLSLIAKAYRLEKDYYNAEKNIFESLKIAEDNSIKPLIGDILKEISTLYEDQEDNLNALKYYKLYFENQRTNLKAYSDNKISKLKTNYEFHLKDKNLLEAQAEIDRLKIRDNRLTLIIGSIIATMIFFSLIYFYDRNFRMKKKKFDLIQQNLSKTKLKAQQLEQNQLQNELHKKQQNIADFSSIIKKNNEKSIALLDMLEEIDKIKNTDLGDKIDDIIKFSKSNFVDSKDQELLKKSVQRVNSEFYSKLDKRFNLSKNDKYLAGLIRLNMNNKEIASIKGISVNSAKMNRYRLKKKLQLNSETDIVIFLQTI